MKFNGIVRLLVADDHQLFRQGIIKLLEESDKIVIVGEASNGKELIQKHTEVKPDVILSDISMPLKTGTEAMKTILRNDRSAKVLFLSMHTDDEYIYTVLKAGGLGLLSKNVMKGELVNAIITVAQGKKYFIGKTEEELNDIIYRYDFLNIGETEKNIDPLSSKEKEVLIYVGQGLTSESIAAKMFLNRRTIDSHRAKIMEKLNLKSLPDLMKLAVEFAYVNRKKE
ncbi:MAG: response regulator transcription factor [Ignavibacteriae bacterium]|jgi:DNA-binding NarL/FixJ family response regulator|nr:DNA-binding response regulator [Ignavibacteriota bacterium]NOG98053.1 response regulator transcription factor [Ignavibacteriota bacterium]